MLIDITLIILAVAIVFSFVGIHWKELPLTAIGGIAWITAGVGMFNVEVPYTSGNSVSLYTYAVENTAPVGWFFVAIGLVVIIYTVLGVLDIFAHPKEAL